MFAFNIDGWRYISQAPANPTVFDTVHHVPLFDEDMVLELIAYYERLSPVPLDFTLMATERAFQESMRATANRAKRGFARVLMAYTQGNPGLIRYWLDRSLFASPSGDSVLVKLFGPPSADRLSGLSLDLKFALSLLLKTGIAAPAGLADCMNRTEAEAARLLERLLAEGYLETIDDAYRIHIAWYRAVLLYLKREHVEAA